jgi:hypothetical protein
MLRYSSSYCDNADILITDLNKHRSRDAHKSNYIEIERVLLYIYIYIYAQREGGSFES